jgi:hypothetical protein
LDLLRREVPARSLVIAIDPGKALNRVWLTSGERGLIGEPVSLSVLRDGVEELGRLIAESGVSGVPVIGLEATGALHRYQLNALCPGLSAPASQGRALKIESPTGQAVLACTAAFAGRAPSARSLIARAPGRMTAATAAFWTARWKRHIDVSRSAQALAVQHSGPTSPPTSRASRNRVSDAVPLAPRQIARDTWQRGRGSPLLRTGDPLPRPTQIWVGPSAFNGLAGSEGHSSVRAGRSMWHRHGRGRQGLRRGLD